MQFPSMRVDDKVAFVTGAGSGLGQAIAAALAHAGADVVITELPGKEAAAAETAKQIEAEGHRALAVPLDVTKLPAIGEAVDSALQKFGRIDILVNNAGINIPKWAVDVSEDDWDKVLDINLKGVFFTAQAVAKQAMIPQDSGKIINMSSQNGVIGFYYRAAYCSSKAGVVNLTRVLAIEWAKHHINVNAIGPTFIDTPLTRPMFENQQFYDDVVSRIPQGHIGKPEDIVGAVVYLASP
ncbi:MAG: SDR family oxidoreductase, partial [Chloroflexi bacterium]|nr:SDR family oxidoreductase [Chloroflexota bacterium]